MPKKINLKILTKFCDEIDFSPSQHASAVKAVLGEDVAIALLLHYFNSRGCVSHVLDAACTQGTKKRGYRLDKWIELNNGNDRILYQVETKNWGAHSIGGKSVALTKNEATMRNFRALRWAHRFDIKNMIPAE